VTRQLVHEPFGWRPTTLLVTVRRYRCSGCGHVWRQDTTRAAEPRARLSRRALRWALEALVCQHLTVARIAEALAVSWDTANEAVLAEGRRVLINDPTRFDGVKVIGVKVIGVDEHCWRHTRRGDKFVRVIIDLTPIRDGTGPARLLDKVPGRSKQAFKNWLADRDQFFRDSVEVVAIPYRHIHRFSVETAGHFDMDAEMKIWVAGHGDPLQKEFRKGVDIYEVQAILAQQIAL
jgi:transposase